MSGVQKVDWLMLSILTEYKYRIHFALQISVIDSQTTHPGAAILTYTFLKYTLSLCTKVYLILGVCTKVYLKNLANLDADTKVYLE